MKKKLRGKTQGMKQAVGSRPEAAKIKPGVPVSSESTGSQKIPSTSQPFPEEVTLKTTKDEAGPTEGASGAGDADAGGILEHKPRSSPGNVGAGKPQAGSNASLTSEESKTGLVAEAPSGVTAARVDVANSGKPRIDANIDLPVSLSSAEPVTDKSPGVGWKASVADVKAKKEAGDQAVLAGHVDQEEPATALTLESQNTAEVVVATPSEVEKVTAKGEQGAEHRTVGAKDPMLHVHAEGGVVPANQLGAASRLPESAVDVEMETVDICGKTPGRDAVVESVARFTDASGPTHVNEPKPAPEMMISERVPSVGNGSAYRALAFVLEVAMLGSVSLWAISALPFSVLLSVLVVALPLVIFWAVFMSPQAPIRLRWPVQPIVAHLLFAGGAGLLFAANQPTIGLTMGALTLFSAILTVVQRAMLLETGIVAPPYQKPAGRRAAR